VANIALARRPVNASLLRLATAGLVLVLMTPGQAAPPMRLFFDVAAQPLPRALERFSERTGISILVTSDLIKNKSAAPVRGRLTPVDALGRLLEGTGLDARRIGTSSMTLIARPSTAAKPAPAPSVSVVPPTYARQVQEQVSRILCQRQPDQFGHYRLGLQLWINADGRVERVHTLDSEQAADRAEPVRAALAGARLNAPPTGLAQPLTLLLRPSPPSLSPCAGEQGD
tara:strand:- start:9874 stop:10557 length:684 start_codon:yes stop_codon:yes gene_type:complete